MGITKTEFNDAVRRCGYSPPSSRVYQNFDNATDDFSRQESAMYLAQLIHESGGFQHKEEIAYKGKRNHGAYVDSVGLSGRDYHGRGYIQLTWGANYKAASQGLGMGNRLLEKPNIVAEDEGVAMKVSTWYWKERVRPMLRGNENHFGLTTKAINGAIECNGGWNERAHRRYQYYQKVADAMGIKNKAQESGCYN